MPKENREIAIQRARALLSEKEESAYDYFCKSDQPALAPSLNAKLFTLWLNGKSCEEIRRLNQGLTLGQIVAARIEGDWDALRKEHLDRLLQETSTRVQQTTFETADLVCDMLAAANKEHGDRLRRYLQTGDEKELGDMRITGISGLKSAIEILQKLTGQERQKSVTIGGELTSYSASSVAAVNKKPTSAQAEQVLKLLLSAST